MGDILFKDALQHALENLKGTNLTGSFETVTDMLNAFNEQYKCVVTFSKTPNTATITVKDANGTAITADAGGTYTLYEGTYKYDAANDGYISKTNQTLTVSQSDVVTGTKTVTVTLTAET